VSRRLCPYPKVPTTVAKELATNPFCRPHSEGLRRAVGLAGAGVEDVAVFTETRRLKDNF
jgi:hydroxyacylglutathione hydrolase